MRQHYLVQQRPQGDTVDRSSKVKSRGSDQYELFLPAQSRQILRIPKFEKKDPTTEPEEFYRHDRGEDKEQFGQHTNQHKSDLLRKENRIGRPKKSAKPLKTRIIRVRRKKAVETLIPTKKRERKVFPQSFFSKNQQNGKSSGQDRRLLDVIFPRSLFSGNQYAKTKWNDQPE